MLLTSIRDHETGAELAHLQMDKDDWATIVKALHEAAPSLLHKYVELAREIETSIVKHMPEG